MIKTVDKKFINDLITRYSREIQEPHGITSLLSVIQTLYLAFVVRLENNGVPPAELEHFRKLYADLLEDMKDTNDERWKTLKEKARETFNHNFGGGIKEEDFGDV